MALFNEIQKKLKDSTLLLASGYSYVNYSGTALYIEGIKKLETVTDNEIVVFLGNKKSLVVFGDRLEIDSLESSGIIIKGRIKSVTEEVNRA